MMSSTGTEESAWRPPAIVMLVALLALVLGAAMIVFVGLEVKGYYSATARILMLAWLALIWFLGLIATGALARLYVRG